MEKEVWTHSLEFISSMSMLLTKITNHFGPVTRWLLILIFLGKLKKLTVLLWLRFDSQVTVVTRASLLTALHWRIGGARGTRPPDQNFFIFMQFWGKIGQIIVGAPYKVGVPSGKSWIRHYSFSLKTSFPFNTGPYGGSENPLPSSNAHVRQISNF